MSSPRQHTPGPWHLNPRGWVVQSTGDIVTRLECSNNKDWDARLIAAAPELLDALIEMLEASERPVPERWLSNVRSHARSAIAKATGGAE